jgi:hypothetical protein
MLICMLFCLILRPAEKLTEDRGKLLPLLHYCFLRHPFSGALESGSFVKHCTEFLCFPTRLRLAELY